MLASSPHRSIGRLALVLFCLGLALILALFLLPIYLDISALEGPVEAILTEILEAPVTVGEVEVNLSLWPTLRLADIEVQGSGHQDSPVFTRVHRAEIQLSLLPLLRTELRIKRLEARDLDFHVHRSEGGVGNWPAWTTRAYQISEVSDVELTKVTVFLDDHDIGQADALIDRLALDIAEDRGLQLDLRGSLEGLPLTLAMTGPTLEELSPKASGFPVAGHLELADLQVTLTGTITRRPAGTHLSLEVAAANSDWSFLEALGDTAAPAIGAFDLAFTLSALGADIGLTDLRGTIGPTNVGGTLALAAGTDRPHLSGKVYLGRLDLQPWLDLSGAKATDADEPVPFDLLSGFDAALELNVEAILGIEHDVEDLTATIDLTGGALSLPVRFRLASIPVSVDLQVQHLGEVPESELELHVEDLDIESLDTLIEIPEGLTGRFDRATLFASTVGRSVDQWIQDLDARVEVHNATLIFGADNGDESREVELDDALIVHRTGQPLSLSTSGAFLTEDFQLDLQTAPLGRLTELDVLPVQLTLQGSGALIALGGTVARREEGVELDVGFEISGDRLGDLEAWVGIPSQIDFAYLIEGRWHGDPTSRSLRLETAELGSTHLQGELTRAGTRDAAPLVADLHASTLDLAELHDLLDSVTNLGTAEDTIRFDLPILPSGLPFGDVKIELRVDRLDRQPVDVTEIHAQLDFQQGQLARSPFSFEYLDSEFEGHLALDLQGELPHFSLDLAGGAQALDQMLDQEGLIANAKLTADRVELSVEATGATLRQIFKSAHLSGELTNVHLPLSLPECDTTLDVRFDHLTLHGPKGKPIVLESSGLLNEVPVHFQLTLREFKRTLDDALLSAPFRLQANLASTTVALDGELRLPVTEGAFDLELQIAGESLTDWSSLIGTDLPDLGPYRVAGRLARADRVLSVRDMELTFGGSDLSGFVELRRGEGRPQIEGHLRSHRTRTIDYLPQPTADETGEAPVPQRTLGGFDRTKLTLEPLWRFDASIDLEIGTLDTGTGPLAHITSRIELDDNRLLASIQRPQETDQEAQIAVRLEPSEHGVEADLHMHWSRQNYGLLADLLNPGIAKGSWSLDLSLGTRGNTFDQLLQNLQGHIDFTDYPEDLNATILDLWGGGFLASLMPVFNLGEESRINCTVGRFVVEEGILKPDLLVVDATRSRVRGRGSIDLPGDAIKLRLRPRPKQRSLINLATPVRLQGSVTDPKVRFVTSGVAVTAFRLSLWMYTVWIDLLRRPLPKDGSDICLDPEPRVP